MKLRLVAGTINDPPLEDGWRSFTLDISPRGIWNHDLQMTVQPDFVADIVCLPQFRDDTFDAVVLHHVLEHLSMPQGRLALAELHRILKPAGCLDLEVPDLDRVTGAYTMGDLTPDEARQWLLGEQLAAHEDSDTHRCLWTETELREAMTEAGFEVGERLETGLALRLIGTKP
jgi:predicted SAM-dependent methyltransferase